MDPAWCFRSVLSFVLLCCASCTSGNTDPAAPAAPATSTLAAAPLAPPVLEKSEPLPWPCDKETEAGNRACLRLETLRLEQEVDAAVAKLFGRLGSDDARRRLVASEREWVEHRASACESRTDVVEGGSATRIVYASCEARLTRQHLDDLNSFLADFD